MFPHTVTPSNNRILREFFTDVFHGIVGNEHATGLRVESKNILRDFKTIAVPERYFGYQHTETTLYDFPISDPKSAEPVGTSMLS